MTRTVATQQRRWIEFHRPFRDGTVFLDVVEVHKDMRARPFDLCDRAGDLEDVVAVVASP